MRNLLIIAYHFPPAGGRGAPGSLRMTKFARYLPKFGWRPVVLTVQPKYLAPNLTIDESLSAILPPNLAIERTRVWHILLPLLRMRARVRAHLRGHPPEGASTVKVGASRGADSPVSKYQKFKDGITDLFMIPDEVSGWIVPGVWRGQKLIRSCQVDAILATGRPWSSLVIGALLKRLTGRPLVVDFRDPWVTNPFRVRPSRLKDSAERRLERWVVNSADLIIANTDSLRQEFASRYGESVAARSVTILNGFDAQEFASLNREPAPEHDQARFQILHTGVLYGKRDPKSVIDALKMLIESGGIDKESIRCDFVGDIKLQYDLADYVRECSLDGVVRLHGEVSYAESIDALSKCDAAILLQPGTSTQIPSKVYEYIGLGKQVLSIAPSGSAVTDLVRTHQLGFTSDPDDLDSVIAMIKESYDRWSEGSATHVLSREVQQEFEVQHGVRSLSSSLDRMVGIRKPASPRTECQPDDDRAT